MELNGGLQNRQRANDGKSTSIPADFLDLEYEDSFDQNETSYNRERYKRMIEDLEMRNGVIKNNIASNEQRLRELKHKIKSLL